MRSVRRPGFSVSEVLQRCLAHTQDPALVARAMTAMSLLNDAEAAYLDKGETRELYKIIESVDVSGILSKADMSFFYDKLTSTTPDTREIYDHIKSLARGMICPLCNQRTVSTLDHYLAKSFHGALAITPLNLVPACKDCNTDSGTRRAASPGDQTFHPYFDQVDDEVWLTAEITEDRPPGVIFRTSKPPSWDIDMFASAESHFKAFKLGVLYAAQAGQELVNIYVDIVNSSDMESPQERQKHFRETSTRRRIPVRNSWQAALYEAAASSDWFCEEGYLNISESDLFSCA